MPRKSPIRFDRQARRRAVLCAVAAASIAACAADGGAHDDGAHDDADEQTLALQAPGGVKVAEVSASGTGCPSGSWDSSVSDDGSRVTVAFKRFYGELTSSATRATKNCTVSVAVRGQDGYQYTPSTLQLSGSSDKTATYSAELKWSGTSATKSVTSDGGGRFDKAFFVNDFWSPCGSTAELQVNAQVEAKGTTSPNKFELTDELLSFKARRCPEVPPPVEPKPDGGGEKPVEPSSAVTISGATTAGSGCPSQTTKVVLTPDGRAVSISFLDVGETSPACTIALQVEAPAGQSYALSGFTVTGHTGAHVRSARLISNTAYTGLGVDRSKEKSREVSARDGAVKFEEELTSEQLNFSPCDGSKPSLQLRLRLTLASAATTTSGGRPVTIGTLGVEGVPELHLFLTALDSLKFALRSCQ